MAMVEPSSTRHTQIDPEKVADTPIELVIALGVRITSRYQKADEFDRMVRAVQAMDANERKGLRGLYCNSKSGDYEAFVHYRYRDVQAARRIGKALGKALIVAAGGHNGIYVADVNIDPEWGEPYLFDDRQITDGTGNP